MILTSVEFELLKTFISIFFEVIFDRITANGKSIAEVREKEELKVQFRPNEANAFFVKLNYKKM